jgi:hypothetical protein
MSSITTRVIPAAAIVVGAALAGAGITAAATAQQEEQVAAPVTQNLSATSAVTQDASASGHAAGGHGAAGPVEPLSATCEDSKLPPHTGFQIGPACVSTQFGEVPAAEDVAQLLITDAPDTVTAGQPFTLKVSTRNLVRDRFLAAADGGYYVERSTLTEDGLVRGHFHTACRVLGSTRQAPAPERQAVFVATEDNGGGAAPDTVTVKIPGLPTAGEAQCATWAGDGSHRMPMMVFANQIPAFDSVRITVTGAGAAKQAEGAKPANDDQQAGDDQGAAAEQQGAAQPSAAQQSAAQQSAAQQSAAQQSAAQQGKANRRTSTGRRTGNSQHTDSREPVGSGQPAEAGLGTSGDRRTDENQWGANDR